MTEQDPRLELRPDQELLHDSWKSLKDALILHATDIYEPPGIYPAYPGERQPQAFSQVLDPAFVHGRLLDDKTHIVTSALAEYFKPHRVAPDHDTVQEDVDVRWSVRMQGTPYFINHTIVIERVTTYDDDHYQGYVWEEIVEKNPDGTETRIARDPHNYGDDDGSHERMLAMLSDRSGDIRDLGIDETERIYAVADYLRSVK